MRTKICQVRGEIITHKPTQFLLQNPYKYPHRLDSLCVMIYNNKVYTKTLQSVMSNYQIADTQKQIRITLNLSVDDDFIAQNIDWGKVLELNDYEQVECYIEDTQL